MEEGIVTIVQIAFILLIIIIFIMYLPNIIWRLRHPFIVLNRVQWFLHFPMRAIFKNVDVAWTGYLFWITFPLLLIYWIIAHVTLTPIRLINALYFDVFLFLSVSLRDGAVSLVRIDKDNVITYIISLPHKIFVFLLKNSYKFLQSILMVCFDLIWPTFTMYHGTDRDVAAEIARKGEWLAGRGDWFGTGIYFGVSQKVARHYARHYPGTPYVLARVVLFPCRPVSTLPRDLRVKIGKRKGDEISQGVKFPWASLEYWRDSHKWYEYCIMYTEKHQKKVPWRVRPICIITDDRPDEVPGGVSIWPKERRGAAILFSTLLLVGILMFKGVTTFGESFPKRPLELTRASTHKATSLVATKENMRYPKRYLPPQTAWINTGRLNVRVGPGVKYDTLTSLPNGVQVRVVGNSDDGQWSFIDSPQEGWVRNKYLRFGQTSPPPSSRSGSSSSAAALKTGIESTNYWVTAPRGLNIRTGPGTNYQIIGKLEFKQSVVVNGFNDDKSWAHIAEPKEGWIYAKYISKNSPSSPFTSSESLCIYGRRERFDWQPSALNEIWGQILDRQGHPLTNIGVEIYVPGYEDRFLVSVPVQPDGSFYLSALTPTNEYGVRLVNAPYPTKPVTFWYPDKGPYQKAIIIFQVQPCP